MNICTTLTKSLSPNTRNGTQLLRHFKVYIIIVTSVYYSDASTSVYYSDASTSVYYSDAVTSVYYSDAGTSVYYSDAVTSVNASCCTSVCDLREKIVIMDKLSQQEQKIIITARTQLLHMN